MAAAFHYSRLDYDFGEKRLDLAILPVLNSTTIWGINGWIWLMGLVCSKLFPKSQSNLEK